MTGAALLEKLRAVGLRIAADGDVLTVGPRELLTEELRAAIRAHKSALLAELPRYRWLVVDRDGKGWEVCCLPPLSAHEMAECYPGARLVALPDSSAESTESAGRQETSTRAHARSDRDLAS